MRIWNNNTISKWTRYRSVSNNNCWKWRKQFITFHFNIETTTCRDASFYSYLSKLQYVTIRNKQLYRKQNANRSFIMSCNIAEILSQRISEYFCQRHLKKICFQVISFQILGLCEHLFIFCTKLLVFDETL